MKTPETDLVLTEKLQRVSGSGEKDNVIPVGGIILQHRIKCI